MALKDWTVEEFLQRTAFPSPAWAGGSAGAVAAAVATALTSKIAAISQLDYPDTLDDPEQFLILAERDMQGYRQLQNDRANPQALPKSLKASLAVSSAILTLCIEGAYVVGDLLPRVKPVMRPDLLVAAQLYYSGAFSAWINMQSNLGAVGSAIPDIVAQQQNQLERLRCSIDTWVQQCTLRESI
ncbi:MAG: cyclodeaminase/cyclohydrolase family protein [Sulfobacillus thermotolerans]|nr:cyclodeaminase/cyclohydrolase family protein [Sulfobacillus thermotolerans]